MAKIDRLGVPHRPSESVFVAEKIADDKWVQTVVSNAETLRRDVFNASPLPKGINTVMSEINQVSGGSFLNATELVDAVSKDPSNRQLEAGQVMLAQSVYLAMRDGGNVAMEAALASGTISTIENALPDRLKGIAREVRNLEVISVEYQTVVDQMDAVAQEDDWLHVPPRKEEVVGMLDNALKTLDANKPTGNASADKIRSYNLVKRNLRSRINSLVDVEVVSVAKNDETLLDTSEKQLLFARKLLERVEASVKTTRDVNIGAVAGQLEELSQNPEIDPDVAIEIRSRLKLHDCSTLMRKANGFIEQPKSGGDPECPTIGMAATLAEGMGHALDNESITFFLKSEANGIPIKEAWDLYQIINCQYREYLSTIDPDLCKGLDIIIDNDPDMGVLDSTYFTDSNPRRKQIVDQNVIEQLMELKGISETDAKKAWELAKKLATATGENSIFNAAMSGNDEMAEDIYLKLYRRGRDANGRGRGPQNTLNDINGIGNSWLRQVSGVSPYDSSDGGLPLLAKDVVVEPNSVKGAKGVEDGSYVYHMSVLWGGKIHPLRALLLNRTPETKQLNNIEFMQSAVDYFKKADPDGKKRLRQIWVKGVLGLVTSYATLGWSQPDIDRFGQFLTTDLSDNAGPFIKKEDFEEIKRTGNFDLRMLSMRVAKIWRTYSDGPSGSR